MPIISPATARGFTRRGCHFGLPRPRTDVETAVHPLNGYNFSSFRVSDDIRIIVHRATGSLTLCYTDHHDPAYAWAERRRFEVHPNTGAAQIVEVVERTEEVVRPIIREVESPLFDMHEPDYLLALGVPTEWLDAVRTVGQSGFYELIDHLPQEASERLMALSEGRPVPRPVVPVGVDPLAHPDAQRRFRILDSQRELQQALEAPWEQWIVFLHPEQRSVAERNFKGPARVTGSAGTGKTIVALHRAAYLARSSPEAQVLLTTFSRTLAARLRYQADLLLGADAPERKRIVIDHLHRIARELWVEKARRPFQKLEPARAQALLEEAVLATGVKGFTTDFLRAEWDAVLDPWGIETWDAYAKAPRVGRGTPLGAKQRRALWTIFEHFLGKLSPGGLSTWSGLSHKAAGYVSELGEAPYRFVVADECQDFGPAELRLVRALVRKEKNDILLCADAGQRIYKGRFSWSAVGLDVRGRSTQLKVNYRTTEQIRRFADGLLPESVDDGDGHERREARSLFDGPEPEIRPFGSVRDEVEGVAAWIRGLVSGGLQPRDIAVLGRVDQVLEERAEPAVHAAGLEHHRLSDEDPPSATAVSIGTMHRVKGLEFKAVVVIGCESRYLPLAWRVRGDSMDLDDRDAVVEQERNLLYVACTRARERLFITYVGEASPFLSCRSGQRVPRD